MKSYKLHLIRHGMTEGNLEGYFVGGGLDIPVCEQGIEELERMKRSYRYPGVGVVFSSPMLRATQTAGILYPDVENKLILEDLRESRFGAFEGRKVAELAKDPDFAKWMDPASEFVPEGGESGKEFAQRTQRALLGMMDYLAQNGITQAACVTHGGVIMSMLAQCALPKKRMPEWMAQNGCGFVIQADAAMIMRDQIVEVVGITPEGYNA